MSQAFHGYGSVIKVGDGGDPETFTTIAEVSSITPSPTQTAEIRVTHLTSPGAHSEKIAGMRDTGPFTLSGNYIPADPSHSRAGGGLIALSTNREVRNWQIVLSDEDNTIWTFRGFVSNFQVGEIGADDKVSFTCAVTVAEDPTAGLP